MVKRKKIIKQYEIILDKLAETNYTLGTLARTN